MPAETIPKPPKLSTRILNIDDGNSESLAHQMRLDGSKSNRKLYFDIVNNTGMLCQHYFPLKESMSGGWKVKPILRVLVPKLLKKFPVLHNYAGHWPITAMVSRHYAMCQGRSKNGLIRSTSWQSNPSKKVVGRRNMSTRNMSALGGKEDVGRLPHKLRCSKDSARCKGTSSNGHNYGNSSSRTLTAEDPPSVVHFLSTLVQDLSNLLPVFIDHGVGDDASLRNMLRMNNWRAWMYAWVKEGVLTELQFQMIVDGLKKLA